MATVTDAPVYANRGLVARFRSRPRTRTSGEKRLTLGKQAILQAILLLITFTVLFPVMWIVSLALDPRNLSRPDGLNLIPPGASFDSFARVIAQPTSNPVSFLELAFNSFKIAISTAFFTVAIGVTAAYAFSRLSFRGREILMLGILAVLMLPAVAAVLPLFIQLNSIRFGDFNLRDSIPGVTLAVISGALPFAIWNLKGYLDTIPKDLEEAAAVDGANRNQAFRLVILPLATPALAVTAFLGFLTGWTEFYFSWMFLQDPKDFTLAMALNGMVGQFATTTPWSMFAAFSILFALPVSLVYLVLQKYLVTGLAVGGVKG
jgi:arabinogalactan oligomer/maltooligosaccharide transport system permease protein